MEAAGLDASEVELLDREWRIGAATTNDIVLVGAEVAEHHLMVQQRSGDLLLSAGASVPVRFSHGGIEVVLPAGATVLWPARELASLQLGPWRLTPVWRDATPNPASRDPFDMPAKAPALVVEGRVRRLRRQGALVVLAASTVLAVAAVGAVDSPDLGDPPRPNAAEAQDAARATVHLNILDRVRAHGLSEHLDVVRSDEREMPVLVGTLRTEALCAGFTRLRREVGADRFVSKVLCMPETANELRELLADTGLRVHATEGSLRISGSIRDETVRSRVELARATLGGLVPIELADEAPAGIDADTNALARRVLERVRSLTTTGSGHVVMRNGEFVYPGGALLPGVELVGIAEDGIVVSDGRRTARIAL